MNALERTITEQVRTYTPELLELTGCGALTAAKIVGEVGDIERFRSDAQLAMHSASVASSG